MSTRACIDKTGNRCAVTLPPRETYGRHWQAFPEGCADEHGLISRPTLQKTVAWSLIGLAV